METHQRHSQKTCSVCTNQLLIFQKSKIKLNAQHLKQLHNRLYLFRITLSIKTERTYRIIQCTTMYILS
jgi:hypothetical protein